MTWARSLIRRLSATGIPESRSSRISSRSEAGSTTTPFPTMDRTPGVSIPEGRWCRANRLPPTTMVWPAFGPPWYRTTTWTRSVRRSTIFPFPSSPHCPPTTTTDGIALSPDLEFGPQGRQRPARPVLLLARRILAEPGAALQPRLDALPGPKCAPLYTPQRERLNSRCDVQPVARRGPDRRQLLVPGGGRSCRRPESPCRPVLLGPAEDGAGAQDHRESR